jgi:RIO kinase 1
MPVAANEDVPMPEDADGPAAAPDEGDKDREALADDPEADDFDMFEEEPPLLVRNEAWVHRRADRMVAKLPGRQGHDRRTEGEVFDKPTLLALHRLLSNNILRSVDFPVSTGKEANVFRGTTPGGGLVAIKIYRVNTATFHRVMQYIQGDERFEGVSGDRRMLVHAWAQKEFRNLERMREAGLDTPEPIKVLQNVLVTEYLGIAKGPWPTLKACGDLDEPTARAFFDKLVADHALMHNEAGLIHADLSEFNILVENADCIGQEGAERVPKPRIIDVGQAVLKTHPRAREFLERDVANVVRYFRKQGLDVGPEDVMAPLKRSHP